MSKASKATEARNILARRRMEPVRLGHVRIVRASDASLTVQSKSLGRIVVPVAELHPENQAWEKGGVGELVVRRRFADQHHLKEK